MMHVYANSQFSLVARDFRSQIHLDMADIILENASVHA